MSSLCVAPYYNRPSQAGLIAHFSHLAERTSLPIVLYNVPGRTVTDILPETVIELAKRHPDRIVSLKDASGDLSRVVTHRMALGDGFNQLSGDDPLALAGYALGQSGCISVTANVAPKLCAEFHAAAAAGDFATARALNERLYPLHRALFADASPIRCVTTRDRSPLASLIETIRPGCRLPSSMTVSAAMSVTVRPGTL